MSRTIFIGDVHGCIEELQILLARLDLVQSDRVIFLGDLVNKGPSSAAVVRLVKERNYETILGNHELSYKSKMHLWHHALRKNLTDDEEAWLISRPIFLEEKQFIAVHGGLIPEKSLQNSVPKDLTTIREWNGSPWHDFYRGKKIVFYGHWAKQGLCIKSNTIGLDSGCVYGGGLSAYILEESRLIWIPSKQYVGIKE